MVPVARYVLLLNEAVSSAEVTWLRLGYDKFTDVHYLLPPLPSLMSDYTFNNTKI